MGESRERVELESKVAFLEHTVDALSDVLVEQGRTIEELQRKLSVLESRVGARAETEGDLGDPLEERPPHY